MGTDTGEKRRWGGGGGMATRNGLPLELLLVSVSDLDLHWILIQQAQGSASRICISNADP